MSANQTPICIANSDTPHCRRANSSSNDPTVTTASHALTHRRSQQRDQPDQAIKPQLGRSLQKSYTLTGLAIRRSGSRG
jgi:hypothetical protein